MTTQINPPKGELVYSQWRLDKPKEDGWSHELISNDYALVKDQTGLDELLVLPKAGHRTVLAAFKDNVAKKGDFPLLGTPAPGKDGKAEYSWLSFKEVDELARNFAAGSRALDLNPEVDAEGRKWRFLGVQSKNRKEWGITHLANMYMKSTTIALYDTLGADALKYVIDQTEMTTVVCQGDLVQKLIDLKIEDAALPSPKIHRLKNIVAMDLVAADRADEAGIRVLQFDDVLKAGKDNSSFVPEEAEESDSLMFSYTSGTTGDPKGVKTSHIALLSMASSLQMRMGDKRLTDADTYISYLPSAHIFEAALFALSCIEGLRCGYYSGNVLKLVSDDLPALKPTFFPSVPRLFNKIYAKLKAGVDAATGCKAVIANRAINYKLENLRRTGDVHDGCYDALVFNKMRAVLGGRVRLMLTGSAPLSEEVFNFLKVCFCTYFVEAYGMTETCGGSFATYWQDPKSGHVGGPVANVKVRLRDIPEMGYLHTNNPPKGEVCFWGPSITKGYFKNKEKTDEALAGEWLKSGDVGIVLPNGSVRIVDRAKNIFKLSQGEYIAPEKLENEFVKSSYVA